MRLISKASKTLDDVSAATERISDTTDTAQAALMAVAAAALVALLVAAVALGRASGGAGRGF